MKPPKRPPHWQTAAKDNESLGRLLSLGNDPKVADLITCCDNDYLNYEDCGYRAKAAGMPPAELWFWPAPRFSVHPK